MRLKREKRTSVRQRSGNSIYSVVRDLLSEAIVLTIFISLAVETALCAEQHR
jgi:post-segregation antitoxin (ccd killing protein)